MIRPLTRADADAYVALRRAALGAEPYSFAASPSDDHASSPDAVRGLLTDPGQTILGAFDPVMVGMVGVHRQRHIKTAHKATIWGVYVAPAARGRGIGAGLVRAAIAWARGRDGVTHVHLTVSARTPDAARLYERLGFVTWGIEPAGLVVDGHPVADHHMVYALDTPAAPPP